MHTQSKVCRLFPPVCGSASTISCPKITAQYKQPQTAYDISTEWLTANLIRGCLESSTIKLQHEKYGHIKRWHRKEPRVWFKIHAGKKQGQGNPFPVNPVSFLRSFPGNGHNNLSKDKTSSRLDRMFDCALLGPTLSPSIVCVAGQFTVTQTFFGSSFHDYSEGTQSLYSHLSPICF